MKQPWWSVGLVVVIACTSPATSNHPDGNAPVADAPAGGVHDGPPAIDDAAAHDAAPVAFTCRAKVTSGNTGGHHNPGMDCMDSCHNHGFTLAGTAYTSANGAAVASGATVTAIDAANHVVDMVVQTNGNFFTSTPVTYPVTIYASDCPTIQMMTAPLTQMADTGCNQSGCHAAGSAQGRIHLP
jgi:hypothetical protein